MPIKPLIFGTPLTPSAIGAIGYPWFVKPLMPSSGKRWSKVELEIEAACPATRAKLVAGRVKP